MLLGFKERFVPFVEDGSKTHTIRSFAEMYDYWRRLGHATLPFHGIIIHWKYTGGPK